jgi:hypothetical protein
VELTYNDVLKDYKISHSAVALHWAAAGGEEEKNPSSLRPHFSLEGEQSCWLSGKMLVWSFATLWKEWFFTGHVVCLAQ